MSSSLTIAVTHAISFLTKPLVSKYQPNVIDRLHTILEEQLIALFFPTWIESDPAFGAPSRVLTLSPNHLPPTAIWRAAIGAGVQWSDWSRALGNFELDLLVNPGCVAFRIGTWAESFSGVHVIWQVEAPGLSSRAKTLAQSIVDEEEDAIFNMIESETSWDASASSSSFIPFGMDNVPVQRSSSRASSASAFSYSSGESDSASAFSSPSSTRSSLDLPPMQQASSARSKEQRHSRSRRSRGRASDIFIDSSKIDVTNYDGGKTTVLTGGVMLGAVSKTGFQGQPNAAWRKNNVSRH